MNIAKDAGWAWWQERKNLRRFVTDLIADTLSQIRFDSTWLQHTWDDDLSLDADLGVDSMELMQLAGSLTETLQLQRSGVEDYLLANRTLDGWVEIAATGLAMEDQHLVFRSSGSIGARKSCSHTLGELMQEVSALSELFPGRCRILVTVPSNHIYGFLFSVLLPHALGIRPEHIVNLRASLPSQLGSRLQPGDLIVGHPLFLQAAMSEFHCCPRDVIAVSSSGPCPESTRAALIAGGISRLIDIYGSSETAGIGWRGDHDATYRLFHYWTRFGNEQLKRQFPDGLIKQFDIPDRLEWVSDKNFSIESRKDEAVQVGGVNVFPDQIRRLLCTHPSVVDAAVRLMQPEEGHRLKAFIVPSDPHADLSQLALELRRWIDMRLPVAHRPKALRFGLSLPLTNAGKLSNWSA
jgi:long-chain acyl-CoA synthetase